LQFGKLKTVSFWWNEIGWCSGYAFVLIYYHWNYRVRICLAVVIEEYYLGW